MKKTFYFCLILCIGINLSAQSFKKVRFKTTYEQFPYVHMIDSTASWYSNSHMDIRLYGKSHESNYDYYLKVSPNKTYKHNTKWVNHVATAENINKIAVSSVVEFEVRDKKQDTLVYYRVFNHFFYLEPEKYSPQYLSSMSGDVNKEISEHFSHLFHSTNRVLRLVVFEVKKGDNIDDVKAAYQTLEKGIKAHQIKDYVTANSFFSKAIEMNDKILEEANYEDKKSRINKKVAQPVLINNFYAAMLMGNYKKVGALCDEFLTHFQGFSAMPAQRAQQRIKILEENEMVKNTTKELSVSDFEFPNGFSPSPSFKLVEHPNTYAEINALLYGSWKQVKVNGKSDESRIVHIKPDGKLLSQKGWWDHQSYDAEMFWKNYSMVNGNKILLLAYDKETLDNEKENFNMIDKIQIRSITKDKLVLAPFLFTEGNKINPEQIIEYERIHIRDNY